MGRPNKYNSKEEARLARLERRRASYSLNRTKRIAQTRASQIKRKILDPDLDKRLYRERVNKNPRWNEQIKLSEYGITLEEYDMRFETQGGVCIICGHPETNTLNGKIRKLPVDHVPGKPRTWIRDLPCSNCNRALGLFKDDPEIIREAANYLERWRLIYG